MSRSVIAYLATLVIFAVVDGIWLGFVAKDLYRQGIGHLMTDQPRWGAAVIFYLIYIGGLVFFAVDPGLQADSWRIAAVDAALLGFLCYATYNLTNLATLKGWPVTIVIADMAWGAFASAVGATAGFFIARAITR